MKFGLDKSTRREPKGCCLPVWWLVYSTNNYLLGDNAFLNLSAWEYQSARWVITTIQLDRAVLLLYDILVITQ